MKKLILIMCLITTICNAQDTIKQGGDVYVEPIPAGVYLLKTYDSTGREVPFDTIGMTIWLLSDGTVRKYYRVI